MLTAAGLEALSLQFMRCHEESGRCIEMYWQCTVFSLSASAAPAEAVETHDWRLQRKPGVVSTQTPNHLASTNYRKPVALIKRVIGQDKNIPFMSTLFPL